MRRWGRYQLRLAVGRASLGRPLAAITWARRAVDSLDRAEGQNVHLACAFGVLATCHRSLGQLQQADVARRRQVKVLGVVAPSSADSVNAVIELGDLCRLRGHHRASEMLLRQALAAAKQPNFARDFELKARALNALGIEYKDTGRYELAARTYGEALDLVTKIAGPDHHSAASLWHNLAGLALAQGHADRAEPAAARALRIRERELGPDHHFVAQDLSVLGAVYLDQNRVAEAERLFQRALSIYHRGRPVDKYEVAVNLSNLGVCRLKRGDNVGAEGLLRQGLDLKKTVLSNHHPEVARQLNNLAVAIDNPQRAAEADDLHHQALTIARSTLGADHPLTRTCRTNACASD
jgi:tetratricopeptide (TPR) repeat protein